MPYVMIVLLFIIRKLKDERKPDLFITNSA